MRARQQRHEKSGSADLDVIRRVVAYWILASLYSFTWLAAMLGRLIPRRSWKSTGRILVTGTFYNPNWYLSHIMPLCRTGVKEVIVVTDCPQASLDRVRFTCWPGWLAKILGRVVARAFWLIGSGLRYRPDLYMGYHLGPGACTTLVVGRLMGRPTCYQMTGGPVEIMGGGVYAAEGIGAPLRKPSRIIEMMALAVVRQFDLIVVRGTKAKEFLASHGIRKSVVVITGSVGEHLLPATNHRDIDVIFVGRLSPVKQVHQFIAIVGVLMRTVADIRAVIVGEGPLRADLQARTAQLGLTGNIEFLGQRKDVSALLARSRVFVLTSVSEGLSIAMAEAMAAGAVPVVADIGELRDLVTDGVNGYLIESGDIEEYARKVMSLLRDETLWKQQSRRAMDVARKHCDIAVVSEKWREHLQDVICRTSQSRRREALR